ncbi:MAG: stress response translation initiation inhibitor YciH, partial [Phycisphaerales bacterium]
LAGRVTCARGGTARRACACPGTGAGEVPRAGDLPGRVRREKRRGKWVTVVAGLDPDASDLSGMLKELRRALGAGGSVTGASESPTLELQGDHAEAVLAYLVERGYPAKRAGG